MGPKMVQSVVALVALLVVQVSLTISSYAHKTVKSIAGSLRVTLFIE